MNRRNSGMSIEFGWWNRDPEKGKFQVHVAIHGGNIEWQRHQGHHTSWEPYEPTAEDRSRLVEEASRRLPRRLLSQRQFDEIKRLSERTGPGALSGRRHRPSPDL